MAAKPELSPTRYPNNQNFHTMDPFVGEIRAFAWNRANPPSEWLPCDGRSLPVSKYQALFSLIGSRYGGNNVNFLLPDLRGTTPICVSKDIPIGTRRGGETVTATAANLPSHPHNATFTGMPPRLNISVSTNPADKASPGGNVLAASTIPNGAALSTYSSSAIADNYLGGASGTAGTVVAGTVVVNVAGGEPIPTMPPYMTVCYMIAVSGLYPPRQ